MSDPNGTAPRNDDARVQGASDPRPDEPMVPSEPEPGPATPNEPNPLIPNEPAPTAPETPAPEPGAPGAPQPAPVTPQPSPSSPEPDQPGPIDPGVPAASAASGAGRNDDFADVGGRDADAASREAREAATAEAIRRNTGSDAYGTKPDAPHDHRVTDAYEEQTASDDHLLTASEPVYEQTETEHIEAERRDEDRTDTVRHDATQDDTPTVAAIAVDDDRDRRDNSERRDDRDERDSNDRSDAVGSAQYVQAPSEPSPRGNRGFGVLISVLQAIIFAAIFYGVLLLVDYLAGNDLDFIGLLLSPMFLITVGMFFLGLVIVSLLVNRAGWWAWILLGLLVAAFAYVGALGGSMVRDAMSIPSNRVWQYVLDHLLTWPTVVAFVLGREVPIWFGAWIAARGRRVSERNIAEHDEYQRQLDEGPVNSR